MAWIRNSDGKPDAMLTMAIMAYAVVLVKVLVGGMVLGSFNFGAIDPSIALALLGPATTGYVIRRYTTARYGRDTEPTE